ncbi:hypothetical protein Lal_00037778 [Lupinus albus]|nr:hypothetical protein Lal_00037778 [Lupinus albus]
MKETRGHEKNEWYLLIIRALRVFQWMLSHNVAFNISIAKNTTNLMSPLYAMYEMSTVPNRPVMEDAIPRTNILCPIIFTCRLCLVEIEFNDQVQALALLSFLPQSWNTTIVVVVAQHEAIS